MGAPWWWPANVPAEITVDLRYLFLIVFLVFGGLFTLTLIYLRKRTMRSLETKYYLHQLAHDIREKQSELHEKLAPNKKFSKNKLNKELEMLLSQICENVCKHFNLLTGDDSIGVAIRLATLGSNKKSIVYKTYARSKGLNSHRKKHSEPIPINKGIPRFLREDKNAQGVLFYNDLIGAEEDGTYTLTKNDKLYPDEIITMMVAPLNAWSGVEPDMIGLIYITSRKKNTFKPKLVDSLGFVADLTASSVANTIELVRLKCENQKINTGGKYAKII